MKRRRLWIAPVILMFGPGRSSAQDAASTETVTTECTDVSTDCTRSGSSCSTTRSGSSCGQSVVRYGSDCGVRQNYGQCKPRNNKDCSPVELGHACYPG